MAMSISLAFLSRETSLVRKRFLANCWVMVLAPWTSSPSVYRKRSPTRKIPFKSMPEFSQKVRSSTATNAWMASTGISS